MENSDQTTEDDIREIERSRLRALVACDMAAAVSLHADDFQLITPIGVALSRSDYLGAIASGQINYVAWEPGDMTVRLHDAVAMIRYPAGLEVVFNGHAVPLSEYWHTDIYERRDGRWVVVWSQATSIAR